MMFGTFQSNVVFIVFTLICGLILTSPREAIGCEHHPGVGGRITDYGCGSEGQSAPRTPGSSGPTFQYTQPSPEPSAAERERRYLNQKNAQAGYAFQLRNYSKALELYLEPDPPGLGRRPTV